MKTYKLLIESAEYPIGSIATPSNNLQEDYCVTSLNNIVLGYLHREQVENRPTVWELQEEIENEFLPFIPRYGACFFYVDMFGQVCECSNYNRGIDKNRIKQGAYRTEEAAEMEAKRRELRAKAWMPKENDKYYIVNLLGGEIRCCTWVSCYIDRAYYTDSNCHRSREEAQKWIDDGYLEAFQCLFTKN